MQIPTALLQCFGSCIGRANTDIGAGPQEQAEPLLTRMHAVSNVPRNVYEMRSMESQRQQEPVELQPEKVLVRIEEFARINYIELHLNKTDKKVKRRHTWPFAKRESLNLEYEFQRIPGDLATLLCIAFDKRYERYWPAAYANAGTLIGKQGLKNENDFVPVLRQVLLRKLTTKEPKEKYWRACQKCRKLHTTKDLLTELQAPERAWKLLTEKGVVTAS